MKKVLIIIGVIVIILGILAGSFAFRFSKMAQNLKNEYSKIEQIDLNSIPDGVYNGSFKEFLVSVNLDVTVKDHQITNIIIKEQNSGKGYEAHDIVDRIIKAQSPKVDAVTGATGSSYCLMIAAYKALKSK